MECCLYVPEICFGMVIECSNYGRGRAVLIYTMRPVLANDIGHYWNKPAIMGRPLSLVWMGFVQSSKKTHPLAGVFSAAL